MHDGLLDVSANMLQFRVSSNLLQRWNQWLVAPFEQLHGSRDMGWMRMEVIDLSGMLIA